MITASTTTAASQAGTASLPLAGRRVAVFLYSYYATDPRPRRAAETMRAAGATVDVICLRSGDDPVARETLDGVSVTRVPMRRRRDGKLTYVLQYAWFFLQCATRIVAMMMRNGRYDIVHVHNMPDFLVFAALPAKLLGAKVVLDLHDPMPELMSSIYGMPPTHLFVRFLRLVERASTGFADLVLTPNLSFRNLFVSRGCRPDKIQIIMNSPNQEIFEEPADGSAATGRRDRAGGEFRLMHHGSIVHRHGVDLLVEAVAQVRPRIPGIKLDIYGARTEFLDTVLAKARELGVEDVVTYHGPRKQREIARAILDCDLGVVPNRRSSFTEINFPTRLFEYLAMGRPVLAPDTVGIRDYFNDREMLYFNPDDAATLSRSIAWAWEHADELDLIRAAGAHIYQRHLWNAEKARLAAAATAMVRER